MRQLVLLDKYGALTKTDMKRLKEEAVKLYDYIKTAPESVKNAHDLDRTLLPIVQGVLRGEITIPYKGPRSLDTLKVWGGRAIPDGEEFPREIALCYFRFEKYLYGDISMAEGYYYDDEDLKRGAKYYDYKNKKFVEKHDERYYVWVNFEE